MNVLAVALSGLIYQGATAITIPASSSQNLLPQFTGATIDNRSITEYYSHFYVAMANLSQATLLPPWVDQKSFYLPFDINAMPVSTDGTPISLQSISGSTTGFGADLNCVELSANEGDPDTVSFRLRSDIQGLDFSTSHLLANGSRVQCIAYEVPHQTNGTTVITGEPPMGSSAIELFNRMVSVDGLDAGFCATLLVAGWVRLDPSLQGSNGTTAANRSLTSTFLGCQPTLRVATFNVDVSLDGRVLNAQQISNFSSDTNALFPNASSLAALFMEANHLIVGETANGFSWHNDSFTNDWFNSLLAYTLRSNALVDPQVPVRTASNATSLTEALYSQLFALLLNLNTHVFAEAKIPQPITLTVNAQVPRLFISPIMFALSIIILGFQLVVAVFYYSYRPKRFLPRMPTSIASIIAYVSSSRAVEDFTNKDNRRSEAKDVRYAYGRFIGTDGKTHVGIDRQQHVVPLESRNPEVRRRKWFGLGKLDEKEPRTWI